jgi:hypothetical protein
MLSACVFAPSLRAEECAVVESRAALAQLSGVRIGSVQVVTDGPDLPGPAHRFGVLHAVSHEGTIRRQLLFAAGDTVDTLLVGETLRRLRRLRLYSDVVVIARRCDPSGDAVLTVRTRDAWTLRPTARLRSSTSLSLGMEEKNVFGSGRSVAVTHEMSTRGRGAAFTLTDPWLLGSDVAGNVRIANLAGAHTLRAGLRNHEYSVFDRWRAEGNFASLSFGDTNVTERALHTLSAMALFGGRIGSAPQAVTLLLAGAEFDSAASIVASSVTAGAPHTRSFLGVDLGVMRRTAVFDTASWIVPGRGFLDVPLGWEGEAVIGGGYERVVGTPTMKLDSWLGRAWLPRRGSVLMLDGWASGYLGKGVSRNQIVRASAGFYSEAPRGIWGARLSAEQMWEVDPDRRGLSPMPLADYTAPVLRTYVVRGARTLAGSVEQNVHLFKVGAASVFDAGAFLAGSYRWSVQDVAGRNIGAGVVGTRLRLLSANGAVSSVRIDVGYPVLRSDMVERRGFLVLTVGTLFDVSRQRDGRRVF